MVADVIVKDGVLKLIIDTGGCITRPLQSLKAVELTCLCNLQDCVSMEVVHKLLEARSMIDKDIVDRYFRHERCQRDIE